MRVILNNLSINLFAVLSVINISVFYFYSAFPDHFLRIQSGNSLNSIFYAVSSFFVSISFFTGIFVGPILAICLYAKFKEIGSLKVKKINFFTLGLFGISSIFLFYSAPSSLGLGLRSLIQYKLSPLVLFIILLASSFLMILSIMRVRNLYLNLMKFSLKIKNKFLMLFFKNKSPLNTTDYDSNDINKEESFSVSDDVKITESHMKLDDIPKVLELDDFLIDNSEDGPKEEFFIDQEVSKINVRASKPVQKKKRRFKNKDEKYESEDSLIGTLVSESRINISSPEQKYFEDIMNRVEEKLKEFKIEARVINVLKGPVVDTFEIELGPGVKVSKVTGLTEDLSLALSGAPIRMIYPIKGKTTMGIEVPRNPREIIYLDDVLKARDFKTSNKRLPIAMGKDAFGYTKVVDLASMPHMLVAGATGAGKSVFINTLLVSLLVKLNPQKLKLILIDPKQLELALYSRLPHLIMPVMTDPKSSSLSLLWACQEMERRYTILKEMGVRNIEGFNQKLNKSSDNDLEKIRHLYKSDESLELPYIVIIVDEFADLILSKVGKDIETNICRLAAKARASGIHLVLATQRPSVDVITGLVKSNFPTRVSFRVTSPVDSRTILNKMGAEKLLGKGDMLYKHGVEMERLHSSYIDENEIENLIDMMCAEDPKFNASALEFLEEMENGGGDISLPEEVVISQTLPEVSGKDELFDDALKLVQETRSASASFLQRRLKIGYNRAANLIEEMEMQGVVGPQQGSKPRKVLI